MSVLGSIVRPARTLATFAVLAGVASGVCGVALIALVQEAIGRGPAGARALAGAFAGLCLLAALTRVIAQAATIRLAHGAVARLCVRLCRQIAALPLAAFEAIDHAGLLAVLTEDIGIVAGALAGFPLVSLNLAIVAVCMIYLGWLAPAVLACGLGFMLFALLGRKVVSARGARHLRAARSGQDQLVGHFRAMIDGFRELKQHRGRREAFLSGPLEAAAASVRDRTIAGLTSFVVAATWGQMAYFGFMGLVVFALPSLVAIDGPALAGSVLVILYLMVPLDVLLMWGANLARARASLARIEALLPTIEAHGGAKEVPGPVVAPEFSDSLRLEAVAYAYGRDRDEDGFALGPVDLTVRPGELVFIAGGNGSGKTTLIKLLSGLYEPDSGQVVLDGRRVDRKGREGYRQLFSVIFADGHLSRDLLGLDPDGLDDRARDCLIRMGLDDLVRVEGGTLSTVALSQGQRGRLALLSAWLEDRPICILDEWAANQDPSFKKVFYHELLPELRAMGKTLIVISHDEEFQDVADRVLRLCDGRLVADVPADAGILG